MSTQVHDTTVVEKINGLKEKNRTSAIRQSKGLGNQLDENSDLYPSGQALVTRKREKTNTGIGYTSINIGQRVRYHKAAPEGPAEGTA
jgi:hypothetical protein